MDKNKLLINHINHLYSLIDKQPIVRENVPPSSRSMQKLFSFIRKIEYRSVKYCESNNNKTTMRITVKYQYFNGCS